MAASCWFDQLAGSACSVAGVAAGGAEAEGDPARPEEALELEIGVVLCVLPCVDGSVVAVESGCWSGPNHRTAPALAPIATARTSKDSAASRRRRGVKTEDGCRLMRLDPCWTPAHS